MQGAPMVPDRPDGRMKPGELQNGAYGFYYKGQQTQVQVDGTILFVSENASVTGKNTADVTYDILDEEAQPAYIVYK